MNQFFQEWKLYWKLTVIPPFLFLVFDFLYRLSELTILRDAILSFALIDVLILLTVTIVAAFLALIQGIIRSFVLKQVVILTTGLFSLFVFLQFFTNYVFTFTTLDEMGKIVVAQRHLFWTAAALTLLFSFLTVRKEFRIVRWFFPFLLLIILLTTLAKMGKIPVHPHQILFPITVLALLLSFLMVRKRFNSSPPIFLSQAFHRFSVFIVMIAVLSLLILVPAFARFFLEVGTKGIKPS